MNDHYSPEFISSQQAALLKEKERLETALKEVAVWNADQGQYIPKYEEFNPGDVEDSDEASDETTNFGENTAMANTLIQTFHEVTGALQDIDSGKYGYCENCGEYISEERLQSYPAAKTCIKCE